MAPTKKDENSNNNGNDVNTFDDLKTVVDKQNETIKAQRAELEVLRKQMEKNVHLRQDFQSELSEIRKNWTTLSDNAKPASVSANTKEKSLEDVLLRLEAISFFMEAYTD